MSELITLSTQYAKNFLDEAAVRERAGAYAHLIDEARAGFLNDWDSAGWMRLFEHTNEASIRRMEEKENIHEVK